MPKITKEARIKSEYSKLLELYSELPENKLALVDGMLQNAAFMRVTLSDLQKLINRQGAVDEYQNGANQNGKKISAEMQSYNTMIKNYTTLMNKLADMLPEQKKQASKLEMLLNA